MQSIIRIGSRESRLAVKQAEIVKQAVERNCPDIKAEIVTMKTEGDKILDRRLELAGGKDSSSRSWRRPFWTVGSISACTA